MEILNIFSGWFYHALSKINLEPRPVREMAKRRLEICKECEHAGEICTICKCPLAVKVKSPGTACPINKW